MHYGMSNDYKIELDLTLKLENVFIKHYALNVTLAAINRTYLK